MIDVFISWSGERSKLVAESLSKWLPCLIHVLRPWMSAKEIEKGERWLISVGSNLEKHKLGIICVTPENHKAPWLLFEAGALSKTLDFSKVCPLLLGMSPSDLKGPLSQFQSTTIEKNDFYKLILSLNNTLDKNKVPSHVLESTFQKFWPDIEKDFEKISEVNIEGTAINIHNVTSTFIKYGLPEPTIGNHVYFSSGFESHNLYSSVFDLAQKRLYIFGRKNRKLFDKDHKDFFSKLKNRLDNGFDFKVLFLDPDSEKRILENAHQDEDFKNQLENCINRAKSVTKKENIDISKIARKYNCNRDLAMVIVDDAILYSPIKHDTSGKALPVTKTSFNIVGAEIDFGNDLVNDFNETWTSAIKI